MLVIVSKRGGKSRGSFEPAKQKDLLVQQSECYCMLSIVCYLVKQCHLNDFQKTYCVSPLLEMVLKKFKAFLKDAMAFKNE